MNKIFPSFSSKSTSFFCITIMSEFDFEKLMVYQKAEDLNLLFFEFLKNLSIDPYFKDQLKRASGSFTLNIAEGAGRFSKNDKRKFYVMARGSVYEAVSILRILKRTGGVDENQYNEFYSKLVELSKMLMGLIR